MAGVIISGDTSGSVTLSAPAVAGSVTVTLPSANGTMLTTASTAVVTQAMLATNVAGNGPAFSAYASATQSVSTTTFTKVVFDVERFDTNSNFASSTFTPTVAGYYQISHAVYLGGAASGSTFTYLYKNGTNYAGLTRIANSGSVNLLNSASCLVYCNGTTDYLEIYIYQNSGGTVTEGNGDPSGCWFTGAMVRSA